MSENDIEQALKALMVDGPWTELNRIASRVGFGVLGLAEVFRASAQNRHRAAHAASSDVSLSEIQDLAISLRVVALAVEVLICQAIRELPSAIAARQGKIVNLSERVSLRFVDGVDDRFRSWREGAKKADRIFGDLDSAVAHALSMAERTESVLVVRDHRVLPTRWYSP